MNSTYSQYCSTDSDQYMINPPYEGNYANYSSTSSAGNAYNIMPACSGNYSKYNCNSGACKPNYSMRQARIAAKAAAYNYTYNNNTCTGNESISSEYATLKQPMNYNYYSEVNGPANNFGWDNVNIKYSNNGCARPSTVISGHMPNSSYNSMCVYPH